MSEKKPVQIPSTPTSVPDKEEGTIVGSNPDISGILKSSVEGFAQPEDERKDVMQPTEIPNLSGTIGQQHPPLRTEITGEPVQITPPAGVDPAQLDNLIELPVGGISSEAVVYGRQKDREKREELRELKPAV